ncbi:hypothetical protein [Geoglobus acetivorans]|uniref:Uncharacterized protein n=1 Tax=Geoglobus acetivorans TaxID=565033 RepID=A0ABZ3H310_GEOAI
MKKSGLIAGVVVGLMALAVYTASAHMGGFGYGFGMPGMMGPMMGYGYGYPMMGGYDGDEGYVPYAYGNQGQAELVDVSGKVSTVYPMGVVLDSGKYVTMPWWFAANLGIKQGDEVKVKGLEYGNSIIPVYIEVNGQSLGDENSNIPVWMQGVQGFSPGYGYAHCPMMGW